METSRVSLCHKNSAMRSPIASLKPSVLYTCPFISQVVPLRAGAMRSEGRRLPLSRRFGQRALLIPEMFPQALFSSLLVLGLPYPHKAFPRDL